MSPSKKRKPDRRNAKGWTVADRRSHEEMRAEALAAARELLLTEGPASITLMAVGQAVGRRHGTIAYHFGTSEELNTALMTSMVSDLAEQLAHIFATPGPPKKRAKLLVDAVFDVFDRGGAGMLTAWIVLSGKKRRLEPIRYAVSLLIRQVRTHLAEAGNQLPTRKVQEAIMFLTLCAFSDSLIGPDMCTILGIEEGTMRDLALQLLPTFFEADEQKRPALK